MPIYEYKCTDDHRFEVFQAMSDDPVTTCEICGKPVERVFHPIAVHFKGSGFYTTDYAKKGSAGKGDGGGGESKSESKSEPKSSSDTDKAGKGDSSGN